MGSKKLLLTQSLKRIASLAAAFGVISGFSVTSASAQTSKFQPLNQQQVQQATYGSSVLQGRVGTALVEPTYAPITPRNSARIVKPQPAFSPQARQATVNRRALIGQGRMISTGYRQQPGVLGSLPQRPDKTILQKQEDDPDFFGENQPTPLPPRDDFPTVPRSDTPENSGTREPQQGELPPEIFRDPFKNERQPEPKPPVEIPGQALPAPPKKDTPKDTPKNREPDDPETQENRNPFLPESKIDDEIDYQPGRGFGATPSQSNVYRAPDSSDALESNDGVYFVPAYDPIPGTHQSTLAPPATIAPGQFGQQPPAWPNQYAPQYQHPTFGQSQYQPPQFGQPQFAPPQFGQPPHQPPQYQPPQYGQPQYGQPLYAQPPYQQPPQFAQPYSPQPQYGQPQYGQPLFLATPEIPAEQQVYSPVVQPLADPACNPQGPMTTARRALLAKVTNDLKRDWDFGDYESCQDCGNCRGCNGNSNSGCGCNTDCPVFYLGFQAAWNDAFDIGNDLGTEINVDDGSAFFFSFGRMNGRNLRTEIELSFRDNDISSVLTPTGELPFTGQLQNFSGMANAYWEFVRSPTGRLKPYIGVGVGFTSISSDLRLTTAQSPTEDQSSSSSSFAYQWMAGLNFKVNNHLDLYGEYRFFDADNFTVDSDNDALSGNFGYSANSVGGGLRWKF